MYLFFLNNMQSNAVRKTSFLENMFMKYSYIYKCSCRTLLQRKASLHQTQLCDVVCWATLCNFLSFWVCALGQNWPNTSALASILQLEIFFFHIFLEIWLGVVGSVWWTLQIDHYRIEYLRRNKNKLYWNNLTFFVCIIPHTGMI